MTVLRRFVFIFCAGWLVLAAAPARSQEPVPQEAALFLLETITVEGAEPAAAHIIRAESLLEEGRSYTEQDLRQAIYRIQRLPIVLESSFALRKGGTRGSYELLIQVRQARRFFFDFGVRASIVRASLALEGLRGEGTDFSGPGLVGLREFVGPTGVLFGVLDTTRGLQVGYSQYDLLNRGIVASVAYAWNGAAVTEVVPYGLDPGFTAWEAEAQQRITLNLAVPVSGSQSLQLAFSGRRGDVCEQRPILAPEAAADLDCDQLRENERLTEQRLFAGWVYDTTDDPLLPTRGLSLSTGIDAGALEVRGVRRPRTGPASRTDYESSTVSAVVTAARHWPVTLKQTLSVSGRISAGRSWLENVQLSGNRVQPGQDMDINVYGVSAGVRHAVRIWRGRQPRGFGDLSLENAVEAGLETTSPDLGITTTPLARWQISTSLLLRNQWGLLRLKLSILDFEEDGR